VEIQPGFFQENPIEKSASDSLTLDGNRDSLLKSENILTMRCYVMKFKLSQFLFDLAYPVRNASTNA
jgi:hypothetical protein